MVYIEQEENKQLIEILKKDEKKEETVVISLRIPKEIKNHLDADDISYKKLFIYAYEKYRESF